jgi:hypothetical protein
MNPLMTLGFKIQPLPYTRRFWLRSQNYEKRVLASSCPSVRPHGTTPLPLDGSGGMQVNGHPVLASGLDGFE